MESLVRKSLEQARQALENFVSRPGAVESVARAGDLLSETFKKGGRAFSCGNGGSMSDAMHFAEELTGRFRGDRVALPATAISDAGHLSCAANDFGWDSVFVRYLEAHARRGDFLLAISTSGKSPNVLKAAEYAQQKGLTVVTLTGKADSSLAKFATVDICAPGGAYADRVQELHIKIIHSIIEIVEAKL